MKLHYNKQTCIVEDPKSKTKHINIVYAIDKKSSSDIFYLTVLADVLAKTTSKLTREQFNEFRYDMYNAIFSIDVKDYKEKILMSYSLNFIDPVYASLIDERKLIDEFINFINNKKIDDQEIKIALSTQKLIIDDIKQDHQSLIDRLTIDELLANDCNYLTLEKTLELIENFDKQKLDIVLEYQRDKLFSLMKTKKNYEIEDLLLTGTEFEKFNRYIVTEAKDKIISKVVDQPIIYLTFKMDNIEYFTKLVFTAMLGMGAQSLLFKIIREQENLCYYVYAKTLFTNGLQIVSGINKEKVDQFLIKTDEIINDDKLFTEELLKTTKDYLINSYKKRTNDFGFNQQIITNHFLFSLPENTEKLIEEIEKVDLKSIKDARSSLKKVNKMILGD